MDLSAALPLFPSLSPSLPLSLTLGVYVRQGQSITSGAGTVVVSIVSGSFMEGHN